MAERADGDDLEQPSRTLTAHLHLCCSEAQVVSSFSGASGIKFEDQ